MSQQQILDYLRGQYGNVGAITGAAPNSPFGADPQFAGDVNRNFTASGQPDLTGFRPDGNGGFGANLTDAFDPIAAGGAYGRYTGSFGADGTMQNVGFSPQERNQGTGLLDHGYLLPLAVLGGGMAAAGAAGAGAAGAGAAGSGTLGASALGIGMAPAELAAAGFGAQAAAAGAAGAGTIGFAGGAGDGIALSGIGEFGAAYPTMGSLGSGAGSLGGLGAVASTGGSLLNGLGGVKGLAGLAGAVAGVAGSRGGDPSTSTTSVPEWALPNATDILQRGQNIADTPFQPYTGQRYAGPNDATKTGWEMANQMARGPSAAQQVAGGVYGRLTSGETPEFGKSQQIGNPYIGQTTPGATNQYIGQNIGSNLSGLVSGNRNPITGQTTGQIDPLRQMSLAQSTTNVGSNPYLGQNNPYMQDAINYASGDLTKNFNNTVNPQFDRMQRASGSFGNSGVEQQRLEAQRNLGTELGRATTGMRMQDYNLQAQLGEADVGRRLQASLADSTRNLGASQAEQQFNIGGDLARQQSNMGYRAGDLARDSTLNDAYTRNLLDAGRFDVGIRAANLDRNLSATSDLGRFNSNLAQGDLGRNTSAMSQQQQFNAQQGNFDITGARNDWNSGENRALAAMPEWQNFNNEDWRRATNMTKIGADMQGYTDRNSQFNYDEFLRQVQNPAAALGPYRDAFTTATRGSSTSTQSPSTPNPIAAGLGGALTAFQMSKLLGY